MQGINPFDAPRDFLCPISLDLMLDPVILHTGHTYDRKSIQRWLDAGHKTCPITMQRLSDLSLTPNHMLRRLISDCLEQSRLKQKKQEEEVLEMLVNALQQSSTFQSADKLKEIRIILSKNDQLIKGRILVHEAGWCALLVSMLRKPGVSEDICLEIMSILVQLRLDVRAKKDLGEVICVCRLLDFLHLHGKVEARKNAAKILASAVDAISISGLMRFECRVESGLKCLLRERSTMGEGLNLLKEMVINSSTDNKKDINMERWVIDKGFVSTILEELLPGLSTQLCEVALEIINKIMCSNYGGLRISTPTIVSNLTAVLMMKAASDNKCKLYAVLILLALCKHDQQQQQPTLEDNYDHINDEHNPRDYDHNSGILIIGAAAHHPSYHVVIPSLPTKLLLVLQSNCSPAVKKHCAELLKLLLAHQTGALEKTWLS